MGFLDIFSGGGDSKVETKQVSEPWKPIQPYILDAAENFAGMAGNVAPFYSGPTYAGMNPFMQQGINRMFGAAGQAQGYSGDVLFNALQGARGQALDPRQNAALGMAGDLYSQYRNPMDDPAARMAGNLYGQMSGPGAAFMNAQNIAGQANRMVSDPYSDPTIKPWIEASIQPLREQLTEQVLPGIRDQAEMYGGPGSRTGLAEGTAMGNYLDAVGNVSAQGYQNAFNRSLGQQMGAGQLLGSTQAQQAQQQLGAAGLFGQQYGQAAQRGLGAAGLYGQMYGQGMDQQARMAAMFPSLMQAHMAPGMQQFQAGQLLQGESQKAIDDAMARHYYQYNAPYDRAKDAYLTMMGTPWGTQTSTGPNPNQQSGAANVLGAGMSGLGTYGMLAMNPVTAPYAMAGGLLAGGLGLFS